MGQTTPASNFSSLSSSVNLKDHVSLYTSLFEWAVPKMKAMDASHDIEHILRVVRLSLYLAEKENIQDDVSLRLIIALALLHDVADHKYYSDPTPIYEEIREKLVNLSSPFTVQQIDSLLWMMERVSFQKESQLKNEDVTKWPIELQIVQDADRLDAIGAIGIARCFVFGGAHHRPIYPPSFMETENSLKVNVKELQQNLNNDSSIGHFYEKLLNIRDLIKTSSGKVIAEHRHQVMQTFLHEFWNEVQPPLNEK